MILRGVALDAAKKAIAEAALIAEDRADNARSMGRECAMASAQRDATRLWSAVFEDIPAVGCVHDRRKPK